MIYNMRKVSTLDLQRLARATTKTHTRIFNEIAKKHKVNPNKIMIHKDSGLITTFEMKV